MTRTLDVQELERLLMAQTIAVCGHETRPGKLSMSWLGMEEAEIIDRMRHGFHPTNDLKMKLYQGTHAERGVRERLQTVCLEKRWTYAEGMTLEAYGGKLTGHPDAVIGGTTVVEIKTIPNDDALRALLVRERLPRKVYWQVQAYILWGGYTEGVVIYEERATGGLACFAVHPNEMIHADLKNRAEHLLALLERMPVGRKAVAE